MIGYVDISFPGPQGPPGFVYREEWDSGSTYAKADVVHFEGSLYYAPSTIVTGVEPPDSPWLLLVRQGDVRWKGAWSTLVTYQAGDAVGHEGSAYVATAATIGDEPPAAPWSLMASKGDQGVQGLKGDTGATGPYGVEPLGTWSSGTGYLARSLVQLNGSAYVALTDVPLGVSPPNSPWSLLVSKGDQGIQGIQGDPGSAELAALTGSDQIDHFDTFTRANGALGTAASGQAWTSLAGAGFANVPAISSNRALFSGGTGGTDIAGAAWLADISRVEMGGGIRPTSNRAAGFLVRYVDANNWLAVIARFITSVRAVDVIKKEAGVQATLRTYTPTTGMVEAGLLRMTVLDIENTISAFMWGQLLGTPWVLTAGEIAALAGFKRGIAGGGGTIDNVWIRSLL